VAASRPETKLAVSKPEPKVVPPKPEAKVAEPKTEPKTATPKPKASVTTSDPQPSARGMYSAQLGAFKSEQNAETLAKKYKEKGYEAFVYKTETKDAGPFYRVLIGKFKDKKEALQMVRSVGAKEGVQTILFRD
jgi:cell division septation protein DedD